MEPTPDAVALVLAEARRETATRFEVSLADQHHRDTALLALLDGLVGAGTGSGVPA